MENEGEKSGEKMMFLVVWLRVEKRRDFGGTYQFSLLPLQNTISPNWRENESESWTKLPTFSFYYYYFFFLATSTWRNKCGLPTIFFFFLFFFRVSQFHWTLIFFLIFFFFINMMMCISA